MITELPPGPEPKPLTAHHSSSNLREHLQAFMCANNTHGWAEDLPPADSPFMAMLQTWSEHPGAAVETFKKQAQQLKDTSKVDGVRTVQLGNCFECLAAVFGYRTYQAARHSRDRDDWIRNKLYDPQP